MILDQVNTANLDCWALGGYVKRDSYTALCGILSENISQSDVIDKVKASGSRGRGGAGFPVGSKRNFAPRSSPGEKYVICDTSKDESGTFGDRDTVMFNPHALIEGMIIAGYVMGAKAGYGCICDEIFKGYQRFEAVPAQARVAGFLGEDILGSDFEFELFVRHDYGAYIYGKETTLLKSLEGKKDQPRLRPPFPASFDLYGKPTTINNTRTFFSVPFIIRDDGQAFADRGIPNASGTKLFCISDHVEHPGNHEISLGMLFAEVLGAAGGTRDGKKLKTVVPGSSSASVLPVDIMMQTNMDYDSVSRADSMLGSDMIIVMDEGVRMVKTLECLNYLYYDESCSQCTSYRRGTGWFHHIVHRTVGGEGRVEDLDLLDSIGNQMTGRTICALAGAAVFPIRSFTKHFRDKFVCYTERGGLMKPNKWC